MEQPPSSPTAICEEQLKETRNALQKGLYSEAFSEAIDAMKACLDAWSKGIPIDTAIHYSSIFARVVARLQRKGKKIRIRHTGPQTRVELSFAELTHAIELIILDQYLYANSTRQAPNRYAAESAYDILVILCCAIAAASDA